MAKYRKKPVEIEAFQMGIDHLPDWFMDKVTSNDIKIKAVEEDESWNPFDFKRTYCLIETLEGRMKGNYGDYIIKEPFDKDRCIYPCKPDIFKKTYDKV